MLHDDVELLLTTLCPVREAMLIPPTFGLICVGDDGDGLDGDDFNNRSLSLLLLLSLLLSYPPYPVDVFLDLFFRFIIVISYFSSWFFVNYRDAYLWIVVRGRGDDDVNLYQRDEDRRCSLLKVAPILSYCFVDSP